MLKYFLLLFLAMLIGCERCYEWHTIEITKIPEYDRWPGTVFLGFGEPELITGDGTVSNEKLIVDIDETGDGFAGTWRGSGSFPVIIQFGSGPFPETFVYTDGKTFQELQIDVCVPAEETAHYLIYLTDLPDKLPKVKFRKSEEVWGRENIITVIEFNKFKKLDSTGCVIPTNSKG